MHVSEHETALFSYDRRLPACAFPALRKLFLRPGFFFHRASP